MKKKIFLAGAFTIMAMSSHFFFQANSQNTISHLALDNIEALSQNESSGGSSCSALAYCYIGVVKSGEVSCTGTKECYSGQSHVVCDGSRSYCKR